MIYMFVEFYKSFQSFSNTPPLFKWMGVFFQQLDFVEYFHRIQISFHREKTHISSIYLLLIP